MELGTNTIKSNIADLENAINLLQETRYSFDDESTTSDKVFASMVTIELVEKQIQNAIGNLKDIEGIK